MGDRAGRAAKRAARLENQANVDVDIRKNVDGGESVSGSFDGEVVEVVVRVIEINLVGGQRLGVSGDKDMFMTEVKTTWGSFHQGYVNSEQEFLILDQDGEDLVVGVIWFNSVMTAERDQITEIVDIRGFGIPEEVPIEFSQDIVPEDVYWKILIWMFFPVKHLNHGNHVYLIPISRIWSD